MQQEWKASSDILPPNQQFLPGTVHFSFLFFLYINLHALQYGGESENTDCLNSWML